MDNNNSPVLDLFHPLVKEWFTDRYPAPTDIQVKSWPVIAGGAHVLITAPTGNGKTLTAFLWALNNLVSGRWRTGKLQVLYVSPLKALNNDIRENLLTPLHELKQLFLDKGAVFPEINIMVRSGDTPQKERNRMLRHPPEILITTPESLNILLSSLRMQQHLAGIKTVILDEIHALAADKRGTFLITAVERLVLLAGEFQRVALSATVNPLEAVADFVGGYRLEQAGGACVYHKRPVQIIQSSAEKKISLLIQFPEDARDTMINDSWWPAIVHAVKAIIRKNRSTLIFANSRALCEKLTRWINENEERRLAYAHHGSLSKEIRKEVEKQLKAGKLSCIVATNSLELGIDIGELDEVILIQSPFSLASAFQRIGRAGHSVNQPSIGTIFPTHGRDFLEAAVMSRCITHREIEETRPVLCPLDVLAQVILAMTCLAEWELDALYAVIRTAAPYHPLSRKQFDMVIKMLTGFYEETRISELKPRVSLDKMENTLSARPGVQLLLYLSGGTIPDRGYFELRVQDSHARIGELDEEFVWERRVGHTFNLGTQDWKITRIDDQKVEVVPWNGAITTLPFWKAEQNLNAWFFTEKMALFLEEWNNRLHTAVLEKTLTGEYAMQPAAAAELINYLRRQREFTGASLPHRHHVLIEYYSDLSRKTGSRMIILHTLWGGRINYPFALALSAALENKAGHDVEIFADNHCVMLLLPGDYTGRELMSQVSPANLEPLLRSKLEKTGFFGARFRENAGRALLLPRAGFNKRVPLWLNRLKARKLLEAVLRYEDFPILAETWRSCLQDEFDLATLKSLLAELESGRIRYTEAHTDIVSPFAESLVWRQVNQHMYQDDTPAAGKVSALAPDLFQEVLFSANLRPELDPALVVLFREKLQRTREGYAPDSARELLDWIRDRLVIPADEWQALLDAVQRDYQADIPALLQETGDRAIRTTLPGAAREVICAVDTVPPLLAALELEPDSFNYQPLDAGVVLPAARRKKIDAFIAQSSAAQPDEEGLPERTREQAFLSFLVSWLAFYGPVTAPFICSVFGVKAAFLQDCLNTASAERTLVVDRLVRGCAEPEICTSNNLEFLLRLTRQKSRPGVTPREIEDLPLLLAAVNGLGRRGSTREDLISCLEKLFGYPAQAALWESDIFPARLSGYRQPWLDQLMQESDLQWFGSDKQSIAFALLPELSLFLKTDREESVPEKLFPHHQGKYSFWELKDYSQLDSRQLTDKLWRLVWQGRASNDSFETLRSGLANHFRSDSMAASPPQAARPSLRSGFQRWKSSKPTAGSWFLLNTEEKEDDALYSEELNRERIRQLFARYGILCRELLMHELPCISWSSLFKSLQIMELSGEVYSGCFFRGIAGVQFISLSAYSLLTRGLPDDSIYWINAADPASLCGKGLIPPDRNLPSRLTSNHIVYHGRRVVLVSRRRGREIEFFVPPEDPHIEDYLGLFHDLVQRSYQPLKLVKIETINKLQAGETPYRDALLQAGFEEGYQCFVLRKRYSSG